MKPNADLFVWGAHAPSRADFGALAEMSFHASKFASAGARIAAREARALPGGKNERVFEHPPEN